MDSTRFSYLISWVNPIFGFAGHFFGGDNALMDLDLLGGH